MDKKNITLVAVILFLITSSVMGLLYETAVHMEGSQFPEYRRVVYPEEEGETTPSDRVLIKQFLVAGILSFATLGLTGGLLAYFYKEMDRLLFQSVIAGAAIGVFSLVMLSSIDICAFTTMPEGSVLREVSPDRNGYEANPPTSTNYLLFFILIMFFVVIVAVRAYLLTPKKDKIELSEDGVTRTIDRTLEKLYRGEDVQSTIIRCYIEMCYHLEEQGVSDQQFLTSREFRSKALEKLDIPSELLYNLTAMFEEARYSTHPMGDQEKKEAIENLQRLKKFLSDKDRTSSSE